MKYEDVTNLIDKLTEECHDRQIYAERYCISIECKAEVLDMVRRKRILIKHLEELNG